MATFAQAYQEAQRAAQAADDRLSAALKKAYGKQAGQKRYQVKGHPAAVQAALTAKKAADAAAKTALDKMRKAGQSVNAKKAVKNDRVGTSNFASKSAAVRYYTPQEGSATDARAYVERALREGSIHIGPPSLKKGERAVLIDGGTRYAIENPKPKDGPLQLATRMGLPGGAALNPFSVVSMGGKKHGSFTTLSEAKSAAHELSKTQGPMDVKDKAGNFLSHHTATKGGGGLRAAQNRKWIKGAIKRPGAFKAKAKQAGKTTREYALQKRTAKGTTGQQARLALTLEKLRNPNSIVMSVTHGSKRADIHNIDGKFWSIIPGVKPDGPYDKAQSAAKAARLTLAEARNPFDIGKTARKLLEKVKSKLAPNPQQAAVDRYVMFHGLPAATILETTEKVHVHDWLATVGWLVSISVRGRRGTTVLRAPNPKKVPFSQVVIFAMSEDGRQFYFRGGDQSIPLDQLRGIGITDDDVRDNMVIGDITKITYCTLKSFEDDGEREIDFWHPTGKEHSEGVLPQLCYHPLDPSMFMVGGRMKVAPVRRDLGASPGIVG